VQNQDEFRTLCHLMLDVVKTHSVDMKPLEEELMACTAEMGKAIINIQGSVNTLNSIKMDELKKEAHEIDRLRELIECNLLRKQQAIAQLNFLDVNSQDIGRQREYLTTRICSLNVQIEDIDRKINDLIHNPAVSAVEEGFFTITIKTFTNTKSVNILEKRKDDLIKERNDIEKHLAHLGWKNNADKKDAMLTDITMLDSKIEADKKSIKELESRYREQQEAFLSSLLDGNTVTNPVAKEMAEILNLLNLVLLKCTTLLSEVDSMQMVIKLAINNEKLQPASVLSTIASIYQFTVMSEILRSGYLMETANVTFDKNYRRFINDRDEIQQIAMSSSTPEFIVKQDTLAAEKKARLHKAGW
jgi:hypothetical protein